MDVRIVGSEVTVKTVNIGETSTKFELLKIGEIFGRLGAVAKSIVTDGETIEVIGYMPR